MPTTPVPRDPPLVTVQLSVGATPTADALHAWFPGAQLEPLYDATDSQRLDALVLRAQARTPRYQPAPFHSMYRVLLPSQADWSDDAPSGDLAAELHELLLAELPVEDVAVETVIAPLPVKDGAANPKNLKHLDPAPAGVDVKAVWADDGGRGQGETLADIERGWYKDHPEFDATLGSGVADIDFITLPDDGTDNTEVDHGTMSLATAVGRENGEDGVGVAPDVPTVVLSSELHSPAGGPDVLNTPKAILDALDELVADHPVGSVLLLEVQKPVPASDLALSIEGQLGPCEMDLATFQLIRLAVALHIVVVEAAGNAGEQAGAPKIAIDLDLKEHETLLHGDSGAILVGQATWNAKTGHKKLPHGVTGKRIDCFSWGFDVYAASVSLDNKGAVNNLKGNAGFGGTSAASAIIAGVALVVQGLVRQGGGGMPYLPPAQMRALLRNRDDGFHTPLGGGTQNVPIEKDIVGVQPDLNRIGNELGFLPDLYIQDEVDDMGGTSALMLSKSPDIILRATPLVGQTPDEAFGEPSGTAADLTLNEKPHANQNTAEVFVRVRNRGGEDVVATVVDPGAKVSVYYADAATLVEPWMWNPIGHTFVDVLKGDKITVAGPIPFPNVPAAGHYCLIAMVEHERDPVNLPGSFSALSAAVDAVTDPTGIALADPAQSPFAAFKRFIRHENNVAWRNFNVVAAPNSGFLTVALNIAGASMQRGPNQEFEEMELRVEAQLPRGATIEVEIDEKLVPRFSLPEGARDNAGRIRVSPNGVTRLGTVALATRESRELKLRVQLPKRAKARAQSYDVALVQLHEGQPVGRVTWRLTPEVCPSA